MTRNYAPRAWCAVHFGHQYYDEVTDQITNFSVSSHQNVLYSLVAIANWNVYPNWIIWHILVIWNGKIGDLKLVTSPKNWRLEWTAPLSMWLVTSNGIWCRCYKWLLYRHHNPTINQYLKAFKYADYILIPRVQPEVVMFLMSNESPYFPHYNPKTSAPNSLYFGSYSRKCTYFQYTNFYFMYFHNSLILSVTYLFSSFFFEFPVSFSKLKNEIRNP